jgi:hypothetical protein
VQFQNPLLRLLRSTDEASRLACCEWEDVLWQARTTHLAGQLWQIVKEAGVAHHIPAPIARRFEAEFIEGEYYRRRLLWEIDRLHRAFRRTNTSFILLKGAAYAAAGLELAIGRPAADTDILVPFAEIDRAEQTLLHDGWEHLIDDHYDQYYYRQWMHELPPLRHRVRETELDLHHSIAPRTSRINPDMARVWASAIVVDQRGTKVLSPVDMILHSSVHLFHDGEIRGALRDLVDIDRMLRHFAREPSFWGVLVTRAGELGLARPLFYALRYASLLLATPVPRPVIAAVEVFKPAPAILLVMDAIIPRALVPPMSSSGRWGSAISGICLFVRSHWLRMSPGLLTAHLARKFFRRWREQRSQT